MPMKITVDLKCDNCKKKFTTRSVLRHGYRSNYNTFPDLLIVEFERETASVQIIKGCNEFSVDDSLGIDVACSVKCVMTLAKEHVVRLVKSKKTQGD